MVQGPRIFRNDKNNPHDLAKTIKISAEQAVANLPLEKFNIFDVDCYSTPWIVARRLLRKVHPGYFGLIMTSGEYRGLQNSNSNEIIRTTLGVSHFSDLRLLGRYHKLINKLMIKSMLEIPGIEYGYGVIAYTNRNICYIGLALNKIKVYNIINSLDRKRESR